MNKQYTCCFAAYHWPHDKRKKVMKCSIAVVDLETDGLVEVVELDKDTSLDFAQDTAVAIAKKYDCKLFMSTKPVPYEKCECCQKGFHISAVTSENLVAMGETLDDDDDGVIDVAFAGFEAAVIACYNRGVLDKSLLSEMMEAYRDDQLDTIGGMDLLANDGLDVVEIIVKLMGELPEKPVLPEDIDNWSSDDSKKYEKYRETVLLEFFPIIVEQFGWIL